MYWRTVDPTNIIIHDYYDWVYDADLLFWIVKVYVKVKHMSNNHDFVFPLEISIVMGYPMGP